MPAPPPANVLKINPRWTYGPFSGGSRFYIAYTSGTPLTEDCQLIANEAVSAWANYMQGLCSSAQVHTETVVTDLSSSTGATALYVSSLTGSRSGTSMPTQVAAEIAFVIARRYRGGHPKIYLPLGVTADLASDSQWGSTFIAAVNTAWGNYVSHILSTSGLTVTLTTHVNYSKYFQYNTVGPYPDGKLKYPPKPRTTAILDPILTHNLNAMLASQRRRRLSTSP